jgi:hypothetical protein
MCYKTGHIICCQQGRISSRSGVKKGDQILKLRDGNGIPVWGEGSGRPAN